MPPGDNTFWNGSGWDSPTDFSRIGMPTIPDAAPAYGSYANESLGSTTDAGLGATNGTSGAGVGAAIGAGLGLLKSIGDQNAYKAKMHQLATTTRFSPWTKMTMEQPTAPNGLGTVAGLGAAGAMQGQALSGGSMLPLAMAQMRSGNGQ